MKHRHGRQVRTPKKAEGYPRPPLGHISSQLTRVKLLSLSYPDAVTGSRREVWSRDELTSHEPAHSTPPGNHHQELWPFGAYPRLEKQVELLRFHSQEVEAHRFWYRWFLRVYVHDAYDHLENRYPAHVLIGAHAGLRRVASGMGTKVYVPLEVAIANGVKEWEAAPFARRKLEQRLS